MDMEKLVDNKYFEHIISILILLPVAFIFIIKEFSNDVRTYQGVARLTDYFGTFPINIDLAYESKPIGNRILNYILYKISSLFTTFGTPEYEILIKIIAVICVLIICYYFSTKIKGRYIFLLSSLAFLTPLNFTLLVPDWWSPLFGLLVLSLFLTDKPTNHYIAGMIITIICLLKGPTILIVIPIICALYLFDKDNLLQSLIRGAISSFLFLIIILFCGFFNNIIPDMMMLGKYGHLGYYNIPEIMLGFTQILLPTFLFIPILVAGFVSAIFLYYTLVRTKKFTKLLLFGLMWIFTIFYICIQNMFFPYHYMALIFPSIITVLVIFNANIKKISIAITLSLFIIMASLSIVMPNEEGTGNKVIVQKIINKFPDIIDQDHILYLESGSAPYYFQSNTSCRFIQSLPFQMNTETWDITDTLQYQENFKCIMNYQNKYIIMDRLWFKQNTSDNKKVIERIHTDYSLVWEEGWDIYERR